LGVWFEKIQIESKLILIWLEDRHDHFVGPKTNWEWINIDTDIELKVWGWKRDWKLRSIIDIDIELRVEIERDTGNWN
jgi:hypothetical protein